jgi:hypothetical protein
MSIVWCEPVSIIERPWKSSQAEGAPMRIDDRVRFLKNFSAAPPDRCTQL